MTGRAVQGMAPYPGQARCLALGFWPECFRRLNVKGGQRPFPEETQSALDIEGKHVTIQGPSPDLTTSGVRSLGDLDYVRQVRLPGFGPSRDRLLFRPDISQVGADRASVMRCHRSLLVAVGCCCCYHCCCQPLVLHPGLAPMRVETLGPTMGFPRSFRLISADRDFHGV